MNRSALIKSLPGASHVHAVYALAMARLRMDFGIRPLSYLWGLDRGVPIHRYYLERYLADNAADIRGHCLEFGCDLYSRKFGGAAVTKIDVLHEDGSNPAATIVADLTKRSNIPSEHFDCIICTHVLHIIDRVPAMIQELHRLLKPNGVLLVGSPFVSMHDQTVHELWRFTPAGLRFILTQVFPEDGVSARGYGNSLTAAGEIRGLVSGEFSRSELDTHDPRFPVEVCARAAKRSLSDAAH